MPHLSRRFVLLSGAASSALTVAGCGGGSAPTTFDLSPAGAAKRYVGGPTIVVPEPTTIFALDSERIVIRTSAGDLAYLSRAQWSDRLPRLFQARLIQTFENQGRPAVGRPVDRLSSSYQLLIDIRSFEAREANRDGYIEVAAKIVTTASGNVRKAQLFSASTPVAALDGSGVTAALDASLGKVLLDITAWTAAPG
ncbi:MAG: membrane integrity-associated transporter subunit PqiC [Methylocystis sp.]|jgi:cholesterol transport system auxiliary component|nr:membrane integrity-associated transporter subunit PqiC [Methylocystis sp.]MCA3584404.1 membrane integrity-associated transporter subunit PqiC [Methylocystis sp.]MCA3587986.1 membrane integrity-associated transporter subunit PqiC [Methylocystis sp.]MCA3592575.1 membrane integrity-associated transporter subunit PqiC [Methylocystis sp.]